MGSAVIFSGTKVKSLKSTLNLFDGADVVSSSVDPTSSAVDAKRGSILLNTTNGNAYLKLDDGSSTNWVKIASGSNAGINYILNPDAEVNTTGWAAYADAAGSEPVDGTGGSPTTTITRSTSSPLRGTGSFLITKDAANRQGEGASYAFTLDSADKNKVLKISFDLEASAGFVTGENSDIRVFIYDVTNAKLITPYQKSLLFGSGTYQATFESSSSTSYRLILHVATTSATAYTLKFDNVKVGPQEVVYGPAMGDFSQEIALSPSAAFGTVTNSSIFSRRVGDSLEVFGYFTAGTVAASTASIDLPSYLAIDSAKISASTNAQMIGDGKVIRTGATDIVTNQLFFDGADTGKIFIAALNVTTPADSTATDEFTKVNGSAFMATGDGFTFRFKVPILGWTTNVVAANSQSFWISSVVANGTRVTADPASFGQYRCLVKDNAARTFSDDAPGANPSGANGMRIYSTNGTGAGTAGQTNRWEFFVGKNKIVTPYFFSGTSKTGRIATDFYSSTDEFGLFFDYDPSSGIAVVSLPIVTSGGNRSVGYAATSGTDDFGTASDCYFDLKVSEGALAVQQEPIKSSIRVTQGNGHGSTNTCIRRFVTSVEALGSDISYADSATDGASFTINKSGVYSIHYKDGGGSPVSWGISKNSSQLSTSIASITNADRLCLVTNSSGTATVYMASATVCLEKGDIIRPHTNGSIGGDEADSNQAFIITRVA